MGVVNLIEKEIRIRFLSEGTIFLPDLAQLILISFFKKEKTRIAAEIHVPTKNNVYGHKTTFYTQKINPFD